LLALVGIAQAACTTVVPPAVPTHAATAQQYLDRGRALIARGEMAAAATALREALRREPDLIEARASLGLALYGTGDLDAAVEELRAAISREPDALAARLTLATVLVAKQDWAAARAELERILSAHPDLLQAHYSLGVVRYAQGDLDGAIEAYRRVLAGDPQNQDARYSLALVLKLVHREPEATPELLGAAQAGHARAQYFAGTAYASGVGVERDLAMAIMWWFRAAEQGVTQAEEALAQLRQVALGRGRRVSGDQQSVEQAFRDYRTALWRDFPDLAPNGDDTVGGALLRRGRAREAVPTLIREAGALSEPAQRLLETLYEQGVEGQLPARDPRILGYFNRAAAEGLRAPVR
jgi:tetratricopeptide (TPR) repeat protein